jgi:hypothetical protein
MSLADLLKSSNRAAYFSLGLRPDALNFFALLCAVSPFPPGIAENKTEAANLPYTTLMFTNGPGYAYDVFNVTEVHWRNVSRVDTTSFKYRQLAAVNREGETHGGEDVMIYGIGTHVIHHSDKPI